MLALEIRGERYNKAAIQRMLLSGPVSGRSTTEQRMQNISHVLQLMGRSWIKGYKPLSNVGARTAETLQKIIEDLTAPDAAPLPSRPPVSVDALRKLPPTGYWMFVCNRRKWDGEAWLRRPENSLLYKVSEHNHTEIQAGDLGILRINARRGTNALAPQSAAIYAIVQVLDLPRLQADRSEAFYANPGDAKEATWRAPLRLLANLVQKPISVEDLPVDESFGYLRKPLMTSTIPISRGVFSDIYTRAGALRPTLTDEQKASSTAGIRMLELEAVKADPKRKSRISQYIERGPIGNKVKDIRGSRCQICEALEKEPVAFLRKNGTPFAEAHHVQPVSLLLVGTLAASNIMVLCPNHHRQAHFGDFEIVENQSNQWVVRLDEEIIKLPKTSNGS